MFGEMYSTSILISPMYSLGFVVLLCLSVQVFTGLMLSLFYDGTRAFAQVNELMMKELDYGFLLRLIHFNGACLYMVGVYLHMVRMWYYSSSLLSRVFFFGWVIFFVSVVVSFSGYSIVYGQLSLWAVVVILNLVTVIPYLGEKLLKVLWGGNAVSPTTLQRIYVLHNWLPMILILMVAVHVLLLHENNSTGMFRIIVRDYDRMNMLPLLGWRDIFVGSTIVIVLLWNVQTLAMMDEENNNAGNSLVTPHEIRPEFYFMPLYGVLRSIPIKWLGVVMMGLFLVSMLVLQNILHVSIINKTAKNRA